MMNQFAKLAVPVLSLALTHLGCSQAEESIVETTPVAAEPAAAPEAPEAQPVANAEKSPDLADSKNEIVAVADYTPPFPERLDLFEPLQRAQNTARRGDEHGESVELKGFIYVDEPRAVLSIDGVISSVPAGGEKYGVQVISIDPPTVVLKRGSNSWPATLE